MVGFGNPQLSSFDFADHPARALVNSWKKRRYNADHILWTMIISGSRLINSRMPITRGILWIVRVKNSLTYFLAYSDSSSLCFRGLKPSTTFWNTIVFFNRPFWPGNNSTFSAASGGGRCFSKHVKSVPRLKRNKNFRSTYSKEHFEAFFRQKKGGINRAFKWIICGISFAPVTHNRFDFCFVVLLSFKGRQLITKLANTIRGPHLNGFTMVKNDNIARCYVGPSSHDLVYRNVGSFAAGCRRWRSWTPARGNG